MAADMANFYLKKLIEISRFYGKKKDYILAGGGNTSFKNDEHLWIKASGIYLENIDESGFVCLSRKQLKEISGRNYSSDALQREVEVKQDLNAAIVGGGERRPSVETSLHELIDYPFVVHTHPTLLNGLLCSNNAKDISSELFGKNVLFVEYTDPGYILFKKVEEELSMFRNRTNKDPNVIFLENHGVFVGANTIDEIKAIYLDIEQKVLSEIPCKIPDENIVHMGQEIVQSLYNVFPSGMNLKTVGLTSWIIRHFTMNKQRFNKVTIPFTPDIIVYCKSRYLFFEKEEFKQIGKVKEAVDEFIAREKYAPKVIAVQDKGIFVIDESEQSAITVGEVFQDFMKISFYAENFGGSKAMTPEQIEFIDNWEVENYRRKISKSG